jgi:hypothetical protein
MTRSKSSVRQYSLDRQKDLLGRLVRLAKLRHEFADGYFELFV